MTNLTLRQLRYAEALARHGHFGRAAEVSSISQPALSMQIRELEASLGAPLFERGARQVRPTPFGDEVLPRLREILRGVDELVDLARAARERLSGRLRLGVIPTVAPYLLPRLIAAMAEAHPEIELALRETVTPRLLSDLDEGRLDAAILALPVAEPSLHAVPVLTEAFVLARPGADADLPVPDAEALREMRLLLLEEGHCFRDQALSFCNLDPQSPPREVLEASSFSTLVQMVAAGIGVTLLPEMALAVETRSGGVAVARFPAPEPGRTIGMVWRRTSPLSRGMAEVAEVLRRAVGGGAQRTGTPQA